MLNSQQNKSLDKLSSDIFALIFSYVDIKDVLSFTRTSKSNYAMLQDPVFIQRFLNFQRIFSFSNVRISKEKAIPFFNEVFKKLCVLSNPNQDEILNWLPLDASSTDKNEAIYLTMPERDGFWGSVGYVNGEEILEAIFDLGEGSKTFLKEVEVVFTHLEYVYVNGGVIGSPIYQSKSLQIELGFHPDKPAYISPEIPVKSTVVKGEELSVTIPIYPNIVFARYVKVKFIGLQSRFTLKDNLFYLCVDSILPKGKKIANIDGQLVDECLQAFYSNNQQQGDHAINSENTQIQEEDYEKTYIKDLVSYNKRKFAEIEKAFSEEKLDQVEIIFKRNAQLKSDKNFFIFLMQNPDIGDLYLEHLFKKQNYLNGLETVLMLNLSMDLSMVNQNLSNIIKEDKYHSMFWLFCVNSDDLTTYLENVFTKGVDEANDALSDESVDNVDDISFHHGLDFQKIFWLVAIRHGNLGGQVNKGSGMMYDEDSDY